MTRPNQLRQYAQMDRSPLQHLDVHDGLESTLTIDAMDGRGILTVRTRRDGGSVLTA